MMYWFSNMNCKKTLFFIDGPQYSWKWEEQFALEMQEAICVMLSANP